MMNGTPDWSEVAMQLFVLTALFGLLATFLMVVSR